jgi:hypothetical protein
LHEHYRHHHPELLAQFTANWEALSPVLKAAWSLEAFKTLKDEDGLDWISWTDFAHTRSKADSIRPWYHQDVIGMDISERNVPVPVERFKEMRNMWLEVDKTLISIVETQMQHEGVLYGFVEEKVSKRDDFVPSRMFDSERLIKKLKKSIATSFAYVFRQAVVQLFNDTVEREGMEYFAGRRSEGCTFEMSLEVKREEVVGRSQNTWMWNEEEGCADRKDLLRRHAIDLFVYEFREEIRQVFEDTIKREGLEYFKGILGKESRFELSVVVGALQ